MKTIKVTKIDTAKHGYLSVSKKVIEQLGIQNEISGYSGHNLTRVYLEEDADALLFFKAVAEKGLNVEVKYSYNVNFSITHNYNHKYFNWKPEKGAEIVFNGYEKPFTITSIVKNSIIVDYAGFKYKMSLGAIFNRLK